METCHLSSYNSINHYSDSQNIFPQPDLRLGQGSSHICLYDLNFMWIRVLHGTLTHFKNCHSYGTQTHFEYLSPYGTKIHLGVHLSPMFHLGWNSNRFEARIIGVTLPFSTLLKPLKWYVHHQN